MVRTALQEDYVCSLWRVERTRKDVGAQRLAWKPQESSGFKTSRNQELSFNGSREENEVSVSLMIILGLRIERQMWSFQENRFFFPEKNVCVCGVNSPIQSIRKQKAMCLRKIDFMRCRIGFCNLNTRILNTNENNFFIKIFNYKLTGGELKMGKK